MFLAAVEKKTTYFRLVLVGNKFTFPTKNSINFLIFEVLQQRHLLANPDPHGIAVKKPLPADSSCVLQQGRPYRLARRPLDFQLWIVVGGMSRFMDYIPWAPKTYISRGFYGK